MNFSIFIFSICFIFIINQSKVQLEGVSCWDSRKPYNTNNVQMVQRDANLLGFVNDLKIDSDRENVWVVSNNLPVFIYSRLDYSQTNFRLLRANIQRGELFYTIIFIFIVFN